MIVYPVLFIAILAASSASIMIRFCDAPPMVIASYRLTLSSLFFLAAVGVKKLSPLRSLTARDLRLALLSGLFLGIHFATWIASLAYTSVANSVVLVSTTPIFVALGSSILLRERLSRLIFTAIGVTVAGAILLGAAKSGGAQNSALGNGLALSGAVGAAGYFICGRALRKRFDTITYVATVYTAAAIVVLVITLLSRQSLIGYASQTYLLLLAITVVPQIIGHTSFNWALKFVSATTVAVATLGEPIGASILAFFLLGEKLTAFQMIGGMLILTGVTLTIRAEGKAAAVSG